jgi:transposase-like protein
MENNLNYTPKKGVHVPKDVKDFILKKIKESGRPASEIAKEHGIGRVAVYRWLKDETQGGADPQLFKLQKENSLLKQLVAELSLKVRENEKRGW